MYKLNHSSNLISEPILCVRQINHNNNTFSQYQTVYNSISIISYLSYKIQLNPKLYRLLNNTLVNIKPDTTLSVFPGLYLTIKIYLRPL